MKQQLKSGQRVLVVGKHPHAGSFVSLVSFGPYGLDLLNLVGWLVRADDGQEFYCQVENVAALGELPADEFYGQLQKLVQPEKPPFEVERAQLRATPADQADVQVVEAEELLPTVSPSRRESTLDKLRAFYAAKDEGTVVLTKHQQQVLKRLEAAWGLLLDAKTSEKAVKKLMRQFEISRPQAYRDLTDCKQLFGDVVKSSREADRYLLKEMALETYGMAKKAGEIKEMNGAVGQLIKIIGIEKADPAIPDAEAYLPSNYVLELKNTQGKELKLNLEAIAALPAHEYEEIMDIIQHSGTTDLEMMQKIMEAARGIGE